MAQSVRDLRWVIESPSLITDGYGHSFQMSQIDAVDLEGFLQGTGSHRVGHYFESLVHYWLKVLRGVDVVQDRVQIFEGKQTVGELDFLFYDEQSVLTHLETAVKFYLYLPTESGGGDCYIGPNPADNFQSKVDRLFQHQLPISEAYFPDVKRRVAMMKGRIFYNPRLPRPALQPRQLAEDHLQNSWLYLRDIEWLCDRHPDKWFRLMPKPFWLGEEKVDAGDLSLLSAAALRKQLIESFDQFDRPRLVSVLKETARCCEEVDRVFVVADPWPA